MPWEDLSLKASVGDPLRLTSNDELMEIVIFLAKISEALSGCTGLSWAELAQLAPTRCLFADFY